MKLHAPLGIAPLLCVLCWLVPAGRARADGLAPPDCFEALLTAKDAKSPFKIQLSWKAAPQAHHYVVSFDPAGDGKGTQPLTVPIGKDPIVIDSDGLGLTVKAGSTYVFRVKTVDAGGQESQESRFAAVTVPGDGESLLSEDFSGPAIAWPPRDGAWSQSNGAVIQDQKTPAKALRRLTFKSADTTSAKLNEQTRLMIRAKVRFDAPGGQVKPLVGLGLSTDDKFNGYAFVFYANGLVAFINDPVGTAGHPLLDASDQPIAATAPTANEAFPFDWKTNQDYWVVFALDTDTLKAKVWPVCTPEPKFWQFTKPVKDLAETVKVVTKTQQGATQEGATKGAKGAAPVAATPGGGAQPISPPETTARTGGYPSLVGGVDANVRSTFSNVLILKLPAAPSPSVGRAAPKAATADDCKTAMTMTPLRSRDSFTAMPVIVPFSRSEDGQHDDDETRIEHGIGEGGAGTQKCPVARLIFAGPARFTLPEFGTCGEEYRQDAAVIHEGMRLVANKQGDYFVHFNISTPAMPVTLRLQFDVLPEGVRHPFLLTLPPVRITPDGSSPELYKPATYRVCVRGHSEAIRAHFDRLPWLDDNRSVLDPEEMKLAGLTPPVARRGTARFGVPTLSSNDLAR